MTCTRLPERNLDVLRAVAVSCVLLDHLLTTWDVQLPVVSNWVLGRVGVLLFFVHTALVLMGSIERERRDGGSVMAFYIRRGFRIYPLAIFTIIAVTSLGVPPHVTSRLAEATPGHLTATTLLANLALSQNLLGRPNVLGVLWSLPLEVQMYALLPFAFLLATRGVGAVLAALAAAVVAGLTVRFALLPGIWRLSMLEFAPCFMAGVLAFALLRVSPRPALPGWTWPLAIAASLPFIVALKPASESPERGWLFCLVVACSIPLVSELRDSAITRAANTVCRYSYGVYLLHQPVLWFSFTVLRGQSLWLQWGTCMALVVALPVVAFRIIEAPGIRLGKRAAAHLATLRRTRTGDAAARAVSSPMSLTKATET